MVGKPEGILLKLANMGLSLDTLMAGSRHKALDGAATHRRVGLLQ
jgi:hypothetical protein